MSYDLMFTPAPGQPVVMLAQFLDYFSARANYEVKGQQAWYGNEDTGVYFSFEYDAQTEQPSDWLETAEDGDEWVPTVATFNLNFNRPSFFALEAVPEVDVVVLVREQLASWRWFRRSPEMLLAPWGAVADALGRYPVVPGPVPMNFAAVSPDTVLDVEYFETTAG